MHDAINKQQECVTVLTYSSNLFTALNSCEVEK